MGRERWIERVREHLESTYCIGEGISAHGNYVGGV